MNMTTLSARALIAGILAASGVASMAQNTQPVVTPTPSDAGTVTITSGPSGWLISIIAVKGSGASELEFSIVGDGTTIIEDVHIRRQRTVEFAPGCTNPTQTLGLPVRLSVTDGVSGPGVGGVMQIRRSFSTINDGRGRFLPCTCPGDLESDEWYVDIAQLDVAGDLGEETQTDPSIIGIRKIESAVILGDVLSPIELDMTDEDTAILSLLVTGNVEASISSVAIEELEIQGRLGQGATKEHLVVINSLSGIGELIAGSISATIECGTSNFPEPIGRIEVNTDHDDNADFTGSLSASGVGGFGGTSGIFLQGSLSATIQLTEPLVNPIWIDGALKSAAVIQLPSQGLRSQIIVNRGAGSASWAGSVFVGTTELDIANYNELPATLAGSGADGSVGLAPFAVHHTASIPPQDGFAFVTSMSISSPTLDCFPINPIRLRMYGPVILDEEDAHFEVLTKDGNGDFTVHAFDAYAEVVTGTDSRTLKIIPDTTGGAWPFGEFALVRISGRVLSRDVIGAPTVTAALHRFEAADGCGLMLLQGFDLNSDDTLCAADISEWVSNPVDLNGDEVMDAADCALLMDAINLYSSFN